MRFTNLRLTLFLVLFSVAMCATVTAENWTRFRGTNGQGVSGETNLPVEWSTTKNVVWKTSIPGTGWSSPIVYNDWVFLTTAIEDGESCRVICVHRQNGDVAWDKEVHRQETGAKRRDNSYATPTPVTDGEKVYAVFADGTVVAVDFSGEVVWKNTDVRFHSLHGLGASPTLVGNLLIMPFDGSSSEDQRTGWKVPWENAVVLAIDTETGQTAWKGQRGMSRVGHVSPILVEEGTQVVSAGGDCVQGHDVKTGERVWTIYSQGEGVTPSPAVGEGMIFTSSGFEEPTIRAIRLGGKGDVTQSHIAWEQKRGVPAIPSLLYVAPHLYTITRDNILHCLQASTGEIVWAKRLPGAYWASPVLADGRIHILSEDGLTLVLRPGEKYDEIARNSLDEMCRASMAVSQGHFYIRTAGQLYCIGLGD